MRCPGPAQPSPSPTLAPYLSSFPFWVSPTLLHSLLERSQHPSCLIALSNLALCSQPTRYQQVHVYTKPHISDLQTPLFPEDVTVGDAGSDFGGRWPSILLFKILSLFYFIFSFYLLTSFPHLSYPHPLSLATTNLFSVSISLGRLSCFSFSFYVPRISEII